MKDRFHGENESNRAEQFWENHYQNRNQPWSGRANAILARFTEPLPVGTALDLGCGMGGNALWLAQRGWQMTAVDISSKALERAATHAVTAGVIERVSFEQHDLTDTFPDGTFNLVYALYLHSPVALPRELVFRKAAAAVAPGGLLLLVDHASVPPWSWADPKTVFPTPQEALGKIELDPADWHTEFLGAPERLADGPNGQSATVADTIIALRRSQPQPAP